MIAHTNHWGKQRRYLNTIWRLFALWLSYGRATATRGVEVYRLLAQSAALVALQTQKIQTDLIFNQAEDR